MFFTQTASTYFTQEMDSIKAGWAILGCHISME